MKNNWLALLLVPFLTLPQLVAANTNDAFACSSEITVRAWLDIDNNYIFDEPSFLLGLRGVQFLLMPAEIPIPTDASQAAGLAAYTDDDGELTFNGLCDGFWRLNVPPEADNGRALPPFTQHVFQVTNGTLPDGSTTLDVPHLPACYPPTAM